MDKEAEERGEGETLARHEKALLELAKRQKLNVTKIYREIVSGETIAARPVMQELLVDVECGKWDGVLVMEVERLARGDTVDQGIMAQTFKFSDTKIITPVKTYNPNNEFDEEYFEFGLFMSRREYKTINRRLQRGRITSVQEGKFVGNKTPYGYERVKIKGDKGFTLSPIPEEADVVRLIFDLYLNGKPETDGTHTRIGTSLIAKHLNSLKIPSKTGGKWSAATIKDMLRNPTYIGKVRWNRRPCQKSMSNGKMVLTRPRNDDGVIVVDGLHDAIIDTDVFTSVQKLIDENPARPVSEKNRITNPLAGIVVCSKCGHKMQRRPYSGKNQCTPPTLICHTLECDNISSAISLVEQRILDSLADWLVQYKLELKKHNKTAPANDVDIKQKAIKKLNTELNTLNTQLDNIHNLLEQGVYTVEQFLDRSKVLSERITAVKSDIKALENDLAQTVQNKNIYDEIVPKIERLLEVYDTLPDAATKNTMLKEVLEKAEYLKTKNGNFKDNSPDDFILKIYPRLPKNE